MPEYTPPELQSVSLGMVKRFAYHDNFGLAILIFQLLMDGNHPFMGVSRDLLLPVDRVGQYCIEQGIFPYQPNNRVLPPPNAPDFETLHPDIQQLFLQTFVMGFKIPPARTDTLEWANALKAAENELVQCQKNPAHWYSNHLPKCHWCEPEKRSIEVSDQKTFKPVPAEKTSAKKSATSHLSSFLWKGVSFFIIVLFLAWLGARAFSSFFSTVFQPAPKDKTPSTNPLIHIELPGLDNGLTTMTSDKDGATLVYVPEGEFLMGSSDVDALAASYEKPQHLVSLDAFWIDETEVTNEMYVKCVDAGKCAPPIKPDPDSDEAGYAEQFSDPSYAKHPVIYVNWNQANAYCSWAGRRLPTEAEWEKAARGTDGLTFPWGEGIDCDKANYQNGCVDSNTVPVGSYENGKSPYGAYDMAGNVAEWVNDWFDVYPGGDSSAPNAFGQGDHVLRGGSWNEYGGQNGVTVRTTVRFWMAPDLAADDVGFRCAQSLP